MSEASFIVILIILVLIHVGLAAFVLAQISKTVVELKKTKNNKYIAEKIRELEAHETFVMLAPFFGPIVGFGLVKGIKPGIPEKGLRANSPGENDVSSDGD